MNAINPLFLSPGWPRSCFPNGIVSYTDQLSAELVKLGHRPQILTFNGVPDDERVTLLRSTRTMRHRLLNKINRWLGGSGQAASPEMETLVREVRRLHSAGRADIMQMEETWGFPRHVAGCTGIPTVVRLHGPWFLNGQADGINQNLPIHADRIRLERIGIEFADAVTAPSRSVLELTRQYYKLPLSNAEVIYSPVTPTAEVDRWRADIAKPETLLFVGRFDRHKGGDVVLEAFRSLAVDRPRLRLLFCGPDRGFVDDNEKRWSIAEYIADRIPLATIRERIEILGQQPPSKIRELRRIASVSVMASRWENLGNVVLEAMSAGTPLVATDSGGTPEMVKHEKNGLLATPGDPSSLAEQIVRLLDDPSLAASLGAQAATDASERFHPRKIAEQTIQFYHRSIEHWKLTTS